MPFQSIPPPSVQAVIADWQECRRCGFAFLAFYWTRAWSLWCDHSVWKFLTLKRLSLKRSHLKSTCQNKCLRRVLASECSRRLIVNFQIISVDWEWGPPLPWQSVNVSSFGQYCKNLKRKKKTYFKLKFNLNNHDIRNDINNNKINRFKSAGPIHYVKLGSYENVLRN